MAEPVPDDGEWKVLYDASNGEYDWIHDAFEPPPKSDVPCCRCHKEQRWWQSIYGDHLICGICHPPATARALSEWIQESSTTKGDKP